MSGPGTLPACLSFSCGSCVALVGLVCIWRGLVHRPIPDDPQVCFTPRAALDKQCLPCIWPSPISVTLSRVVRSPSVECWENPVKLMAVPSCLRLFLGHSVASDSEAGFAELLPVLPHTNPSSSSALQHWNMSFPPQL